MICASSVFIVENVPTADVVAPITVASTVPPLISAVVAVRSANVETPVAETPASFSTTPSTSTPWSSVFSLIVSTDIEPALIVPAFEIPAFATLIPCVVTISELNVMSPFAVNASIVSTFSVPDTFVSTKLAFAAVVAPITVPSMLPPFRSTESDASVENVPPADVVAPITTLSIAEPAAPSTSNVPSTSSVLPAPTVTSNCEIVTPVPPCRLAESIVPPEILSPEIWSFASVSVPPDRSTEPPVIATASASCVAIEPRPRLSRAVALPAVCEASTPRPPRVSGRAPDVAFGFVRSSAPYATPPAPSDFSTSPVVDVPLIVSASEPSTMMYVPSTFTFSVLPAFDRASPAVI